jgi:polysaccharide biosynthesis/export protein
MQGFRVLGVIFILVNALGGCLFLPSSGPNSLDVSIGASPSGTTYTVIKLTPEVVKTLAEYGPLTLSAAFGDKRPPPEIKFGIGDVVSVSVFEAAAGGLFIPIEAGVRPGNFVTLPNQPVDTSGNISVPYAGAIKTAGRTPSQVGQTIVDAIKTRAIEPQVVVALVTQNTSLISVLGEVNVPNRFPAMPAGEHLLDSITRGGGIKDQGYESWVVLERGGRRAAVPFGAMIYEPGNNIWAWPGDTVYVYREPQTFLAFGASGQQGQFPFNAWRVSLAEAVGLAGGLLDVQADPSSVFLYRREPRELAEKLGIDCSKYEGPTVPVVYNVSFKDPGGYFLATKVQMYNKDVIFAANSQSVDVTKFFNFVNTVVAPANGIASTGIDIETWRVLSHTR